MNLVTYRDARNLKPKLVANSNDINFSLGSPIESRNILRRSKFKIEDRSKEASPDDADRTFPNRCHPNIIQGLNRKKTIADVVG